MIVRVQSKNGTKRITANSSDLLRTLLEKVSQLVMNTETRSSCTTANAVPQVTREFQLDESQSFSVYRSAGYRNELSQKELGLTLQAIPIKLVVHVTS